MKTFLIKLTVLVLPLIFLSISLEIYLRSIPNDYSYKNEFLEQNSGKLEYIFFGSSHSYYGINPEYIEGHSFNASHIAQSLDYDYAIFNKYNKKLRNLKAIIIPIDYFSLVLRLSNGVQKWRIKNYEIYYNIHKSDDLRHHYEILGIKFSENIIRLYNSLKSREFTSITCNELGFCDIIKDQSDLYETGILAAKRHTKKDWRYFNPNVSILNDFIGYAKDKDIEIVFITFPAFQSYLQNLKDEQLNITIKTVRELTENNDNCSYYNFLNDSDFESNDFRDADHLNTNGAIKFTEKLNSILNK